MEITGRYFGPLHGEPHAYTSPYDRTVIPPSNPDMPPSAAQLGSSATRNPGTMELTRDDGIRDSQRELAGKVQESPVDDSVYGKVEFLMRLGLELPIPSYSTRDGYGSADESIERRTSHDDSTISPPASPQATQVQSGPCPRIPQGQTRPVPQHAMPGSNTTRTYEWIGLLREDDLRVDADLSKNINHMIRDSMTSQDRYRSLPTGTSLTWCSGSIEGCRLLQELQRLLIAIGPHSPATFPQTRGVGKAMMEMHHFLNGEGFKPFAGAMCPPPYAHGATSQMHQRGRSYNSAFGSQAGPSAQASGECPPKRQRR